MYLTRQIALQKRRRRARLAETSRGWADLQNRHKIGLAHRIHQSQKQVIGFALVFDQGIALAIAPESDALAQIIDLVQMIHPERVERAQIERFLDAIPALFAEAASFSL